MYRAISEMKRVLRDDGRIILVVGDSMIRDVFVENSAAVLALARSVGLRQVSKRRRQIPSNRRYLPPPHASTSGESLAARMRSEVVLTLAKS